MKLLIGYRSFDVTDIYYQIMMIDSVSHAHIENYASL